ncbi:MAG: PDZ domain-containing protein, partial [Candidatus Eisenbacteria bacterium]|nr:PDZ domain-containing protein [Candidatus Eisenbacteria bacterium]
LTLRAGAAWSAQNRGAAPLKIETSESGYGGSDHFPFYAKNVPVLFLFTGAHEDYHKVTDDWEKINVEGLSSVVELASRILAEVVFTDMPIPFTRAAADTSGPPGGEGYGRGSGAHFGIVPDFGGEAGRGAKISGTTEGSPAEKAGLKAGDVIVRFAGKTITGLQDLSYALREKRPGDEVEVVVFREGKEIVFKATLATRGAR